MQQMGLDDPCESGCHKGYQCAKKSNLISKSLGEPMLIRLNITGQDEPMTAQCDKLIDVYCIWQSCLATAKDQTINQFMQADNTISQRFA